MAAETRTTEDRVYIGRRTHGERLAYAYLVNGEETWFKKPFRPGAQVGQIVRLTTTGGGTFYATGPDAPTVVGMADVDEATLTGWQVADRAAYERKAQADADRRAVAARSYTEDHIDALAAAAATLSSADREAFIRYVSSRIRTNG